MAASEVAAVDEAVALAVEAVVGVASMRVAEDMKIPTDSGVEGEADTRQRQSRMIYHLHIRP